MKNKNRIDIEEVACVILDLDYEDYEESNECTEQIENILIDEMNIDLDTLERIVSKLLPFIEVGKSPLTGIVYKGFSREFIKGSCKVRKWIAKMQIDE
jgi:hypothetical protein